MGAISNLTLTDGEATPVDRVFVPVDRQADFAKWSHTPDGGVLAASDKLWMAIRRPTVGPPNAQSRVNTKAEIALVTPIMETIGTEGSSLGYVAAPQVAYTLGMKVVLTFPTRCLEQDRLNLHAMYNSLTTQQVLQDLYNKAVLPY